MNLTFFCLVIQCLVYNTFAKYSKDVVCVIDKDQYPVCKAVPSASRRHSMNPALPSHDPYIPRLHAVYYNCTSLICEPLKLLSLTQVTDPNLHLKSCYLYSLEKFECDDIKYNNFKNEDKLVFLRSNIQNKTFYLVNCLIYPDSGRVCHRKDAKNSHAELVDVGALVRPKEDNILSQEEFLCEETDDKQVNCDINSFVPFKDGLKLKQSIAVEGDILLKSGSHAITLSRSCKDSWCGFSSKVQTPTRRYDRYEPPGGKVFRCYYANRQQVCKMLYDKNDRYYYGRSYFAPLALG